jgi:hypothetical protein
MASLWPADCQTCGNPPGTQPPALCVDNIGAFGMATLHHEHSGLVNRALTVKRQDAVPVISLHPCGDGVPDLTRGGGSYACPRSGCPLG